MTNDNMRKNNDMMMTRGGNETLTQFANKWPPRHIKKPMALTKKSVIES